MLNKIKIIVICHGKTEQKLFSWAFDNYIYTNENKKIINGISSKNFYSILYKNPNNKKEDSSIQINNFESEILNRFDLEFIKRSSIGDIKDLKETKLFFLTLIDIDEENQKIENQKNILDNHEKIIEKILKSPDCKINKNLRDHKLIDNYQKSFLISFREGFEKCLKNYKNYKKEMKENGSKKSEFLYKKLKEIPPKNINTNSKIRKYCKEKIDIEKTNFLKIFDFFDLVINDYIDLNN